MDSMTVTERLITAVPTPFDNTGELDLTALHDLLVDVAPRVDAVLMAGTTGEFPALTDEERLAVFAEALAVFGPERTIAHIGHASSRQVTRIATAARDIGVGRFALLTPFYLPTDEVGLSRWFRDGIDAVRGAELYLYVFPERTGISVSPSHARDLLDLPGVSGLKVSGTPTRELPEYIAAIRPGQRLWSGDDATLPTVITAGGEGVISGVSAALPRLFGDLRDVLAEGADAASLQTEVMRAVSHVGPTIPRLHRALHLRSGHTWATRMSGPDVSAEDTASIEALVAAERNRGG